MDFMPSSWHSSPMASSAHKIPLFLRREWAEPIGSTWVPTQKLELLSSITDALWHSDLWKRILQWDAAQSRDRKPKSHYGAIPLRKEGKDGNYEDPGNREYRNALWLLETIAIKLNFSPLHRIRLVINDKSNMERAGDILEAVIGEMFEGMEGHGDDDEWWKKPWEIDASTAQGCAVARFLTFYGKFQRLQAGPLRIDCRADISRIWGSEEKLDEQLTILRKRRDEHGEAIRVRSLAGQHRTLLRDQARAEMRKAKGKGKGKGKDKGK